MAKDPVCGMIVNETTILFLQSNVSTDFRSTRKRTLKDVLRKEAWSQK
jgi:hypothetical protein